MDFFFLKAKLYVKGISKTEGRELIYFMEGVNGRLTCELTTYTVIMHLAKDDMNGRVFLKEPL